ncbi:efflux RND transporter periplasmic adaptor subunit [Pacificoceanicola onchidii]|uniref:efflux RND transporter periplasmic adaptor subunit n=1 Tax=Pacificoceanicola onchidii TaxID=2562685 RepID=UPI0010A4C081|nr:HlyD family efflux transporter periplasmic adaptor subunit [Pacificoceanicola onchidii]
MRFLRKSLTGLFLMAVTLSLLVYAGTMVRDAVEARMSEEPRMPRGQERVFAVNVVTVTPETIVPVLRAFGEVQSSRTLELRAATGGALIDLAPEFVEGGRVEAGQVLARIDPADAQAALDRAESDLLDAGAEQREAERAVVLAQDELAAAQDQVALREKALQRQNDLRARNVGTAAAVETAELALSSARQAVLSHRQSVATAQARIDQSVTRLRRAEIALSEARRGLADTEVRAEFAGLLSDVSVVAGRLVSSNEKLGEVVDAQSLEVAFRVSTQEYARLLDENGVLQRSDVTVTLDVFGTNIQAEGQISRESAAVGEGQTGRRLFATLSAPRGFKPGDFVTVSAREAPLERVARVPSTAVDASGTVLMIGEEDRLASARVQVMRRQGDDVLIRAGAISGAEIVAERTPLLGAGIKVNPLRVGAAPQVAAAPEMIELSDERRARLRAFIEANKRMPAEVKSRLLGQLEQAQVPAAVVARIEARMGG